jgi:hypothetical protein
LVKWIILKNQPNPGRVLNRLYPNFQKKYSRWIAYEGEDFFLSTTEMSPENNFVANPPQRQTLRGIGAKKENSYDDTLVERRNTGGYGWR